MQYPSSPYYENARRFCIVALLLVACTDAGVCQKTNSPTEDLIDPDSLPGAAVKIGRREPLTLKKGGSVIGARAWLEELRKQAAKAGHQGTCSFHEVKKMTWEASTTKLTITWSFETRCKFVRTTAMYRFSLAPGKKGSDEWAGTSTYSLKAVQNGRALTDPNASFKDDIKATVTYGSDEESKQEEVKKFNSEVREAIKQIQEKYGDDLQSAWEYADTTFRDERGHDTVSVAVEHYLAGLLMHESTLWFHEWAHGFAGMEVPVGLAVAWELVTAASISVLGEKPKDNPSYTIKLPFVIPNPWGNPVSEWNLTGGWLNPGDRGNLWSWVVFWGAAGLGGETIDNLATGRPSPSVGQP